MSIFTHILSGRLYIYEGTVDRSPQNRRQPGAGRAVSHEPHGHAPDPQPGRGERGRGPGLSLRHPGRSGGRPPYEGHDGGRGAAA